MAGILFWTAYAGWMAVFVRIAWCGRWRLLLALGTAMVLKFVLYATHLDAALADPGRDRSGDFGYGIAKLFAAAMLLVPLALAAIAYPIGRLWTR